MVGDNPAFFQLKASPEQDMILALVTPILLTLLTIPFTILRVLLLGWNCALARQPFPDEDDDDEVRVTRAGKARNCFTVCCGVSGMMMFTNLLMLVVGVYVLVVYMSTSEPLVRTPTS